MIKQGIKGKIVNIASGGEGFGFPGRPVYGASKADVENFTRSTAMELCDHGIRVNAIALVPTCNNRRNDVHCSHVW